MNTFITTNFDPSASIAHPDVTILQRHVTNHILNLIQEIDGYEYALKLSQQSHDAWKREFVCKLGKSGTRKGESIRYDCGGVVKVGCVKEEGNVEIEWRHHAVHRSAEEEKMEKIRKKAENREAPTLYAVKDTGLVEEEVEDVMMFQAEEESDTTPSWPEQDENITTATTPAIWALQDRSAIQDHTRERTMAEIYRDWNLP
ncbi:hypothetical protein BDD12DRAFT_814860 [Trichophaea hybrida]|nr:hypothetical protein BDD12DRAFT_814860 [Trichophaea hybrida]